MNPHAHPQGPMMLLIFGGLPGSGKSTIAKLLADELQAIQLRIDSIEQALRNRGFEITGPEGYIAAWAIAEDCLRGGHTVIADSVNPIQFTRSGWRDSADRVGVPYLEIHVICSDQAEHRRRAEDRVADIPGHDLPTWQQILDRDFEPWQSSTILETAGLSPDETLLELKGVLAAKGCRLPSDDVRTQKG